MAKWGEGDPRWIVEERSDSHNVNNWHWKEVGKSCENSDFAEFFENGYTVFVRNKTARLLVPE